MSAKKPAPEPEDERAFKLDETSASILLSEIDAVALDLGLTFDDLPAKQQGAAIVLSHSLAALRRKLTNEGRSG